jgi:ABC-type cobalamin/Fe3+-siderophores transport system ATPase subunit
MMALMGASGAGKSSLLDCISLRNQKFQGHVLLDGTPVNETFFGMTGEKQDYRYSLVGLMSTCYRSRGLCRLDDDWPYQRHRDSFGPCHPRRLAISA